MRNVRVAAVQFQHLAGDKQANRDQLEKLVARAEAHGVEIAVSPECCLSGYWHLRDLDRDALWDLAELVPNGECTEWLRELSNRSRMTIGAGFIERTSSGKMYNSYVVAMPDGNWVVHRKLHVFVNPFLTPGDHYTVFDTPHGCRAAVLICYDNNLVENARICAIRGAQVLLAPHQTGGCKSGSPFAMGAIDTSLWENRDQEPEALRKEFLGDKGRGWIMRWLPSRAHDNGMYVVFSNGVGRDGNEVRTGNSMVLDCYGRIVSETQSIGEDVVIGDLDATLQERSTGARWLKARRPELYGELAVPTGREQDTRTVRFQYEQ